MRGGGFRRLDVRGLLRASEWHAAGRARGRDMDERWRAAAGAETAGHTRAVAFKRGVLRIAVDSSALLQEMAAFRRKELLARLNAEGAQPAVSELRFEIGRIYSE